MFNGEHAEPVIIVEGLNGAGKSTYVEALSKATGQVPFRVFRDDVKGHWDTDWAEHKGKLEALGVPVNTLVDELYTATFLRRFPSLGFVLDRSMWSAIAYGRVEKQPQFLSANEHIGWALKYWEQALLQHGNVLVVYLVVGWDDAKDRLAKERLPTRTKFNALKTQFDRMFALSPLNKMMIDTSVTPRERGAELVLGKLPKD